MKSDEPFHEIGKLLRSQHPDPRPSPGLELRILRAVNQPPRPAKASLWPWFLIPPALAMAVVLMWPQSTTPVVAPVVVRQADPPPVEIAEPAIALAVNEINPLRKESRALRRDAERAGRFLIDCLPSFRTTP